MKDANLPTSHRIRKFFGTSSVPKLPYRVDVDTPHVIQLESPRPITLRVQILPSWDETSESLRNMQQVARLLQLLVVIKEFVQVICDNRNNIRHEIPFYSMTVNIDKVLAQREQPLGIPFVEEDGEAKDIGIAANLRFGHRGLADGGSYSGRLNTGCTMHKIKIGHKLTYTLKGEMAGENFKAEPINNMPIKVLLPGASDSNDKPAIIAPLHSESWIQPPLKITPKLRQRLRRYNEVSRLSNSKVDRIQV